MKKFLLFNLFLFIFSFNSFSKNNLPVTSKAIVEIRAEVIEKYKSVNKITKSEKPCFFKINNDGDFKFELDYFEDLNKPIIKVSLDRNNKIFKDNNTELTSMIKLIKNESIVTISVDLKNKKLKDPTKAGYIFMDITVI